MQKVEMYHNYLWYHFPQSMDNVIVDEVFSLYIGTDNYGRKLKIILLLPIICCTTLFSNTFD